LKFIPTEVDGVDDRPSSRHHVDDRGFFSRSFCTTEFR